MIQAIYEKAEVSIFEKWKETIHYIQENDAAKPSFWEVVLAYPGFHAVAVHEITHILWNNKFRVLARILSNITRFFTGIEIHPGAKLGRKVFIDHGAGAVIGEQVIIGNRVTIYHAVTLGSGSKTVDGRRHPIIGHDVLLGAGAKILGPVKIGDKAQIGANSVVIKNIPRGATAVGIPARVISEEQRSRISLSLQEV
jgi:serine O-acetyltransferase